jgi:hypothetical protein
MRGDFFGCGLLWKTPEKAPGKGILHGVDLGCEKMGLGYNVDS